MNYLIDPLVYCEKGSSKKYDPLLAMIDTWFLWGLEVIWTLIPTLVLNTNKIFLLAFIFLKHSDWFEISAQKLAFIALLAAFHKAITSVWKLAWSLFTCLNVKTFVTLKDYLVP